MDGGRTLVDPPGAATTTTPTLALAAVLATLLPGWPWVRSLIAGATCTKPGSECTPLAAVPSPEK